jgi:hypothetical protein
VPRVGWRDCYWDCYKDLRSFHAWKWLFGQREKHVMPPLSFRRTSIACVFIAALGALLVFRSDVKRSLLPAAFPSANAALVIIRHRVAGALRSITYHMRVLANGSVSASATAERARESIASDDEKKSDEKKSREHSAPSALLPFGTLAPDYKVPHSFRPYSPNSTWNQKLGPSPKLDRDDAAKIAWTFTPSFHGGQSADQLTSTDPFNGAGLPVWFARRTDPLVNVRCHAAYGPGGNNACPLSSKVYVPSRASAADDIDHHMVIIQPDGIEVDVWEWGAGNLAYAEHPPGQQLPPWQTGQTIEVGWGGTANLVNGTGWDSGSANGAAMVSGSNLLAGYIFASEIQAGRINHAIAVLLPCNPVNNVYPAPIGAQANTDCHGAATSGRSPVGVGARYWLDTPDATIDGYNIPRGEKTTLHALHDYGAFHVDTNAYAFQLDRLESPQAGVTYGDNFATPIYTANFNNVDGVDIAITGAGTANDDFDTYVRPHLHVLDPCVNNGYPGGQCTH